MDNQKEQPHHENLLGFSVKTRSFDSEQFVFEYTVLPTDIRYQTSALENKQQTTVWVYEAEITSPKNGSLNFMVDGHNCQFSIEIQGNKTLLNPKESFEQITLDDLQKGEKIKVTLTATTDGLVPNFRFLWDANNGISPTTPLLPQSRLFSLSMKIIVPQIQRLLAMSASTLH